MEALIIIGIIVIIGIVATVKKMNNEDSPLTERIRLNEMKVEDTFQNGGIESPKGVNMSSDEDSFINDKPDTTGLMEHILTELGCRPKKENDRELTVAYQGENFVIKTGGLYAQIWDPAWAQINVNDPNFEKMKTAANISNFEFGPTILYTSPNEEGVVWLHAKQEIILFPAIPERNEYIKSVFNSFFEKKENMRGQFQALINQQQQTPRPHRPVGFSTSEDENS